MGNIFTLESMREEIEREFAPFQIDLGDDKVVTLRNVLRLPKKDRDVVYRLLDELSSDSESDSETGLSSTERSAEVALKIFPLVAESEKAGRQLVESLGDDLALTLRVFSAWMKGAQVGEAESLDS